METLRGKVIRVVQYDGSELVALVQPIGSGKKSKNVFVRGECKSRPMPNGKIEAKGKWSYSGSNVNFNAQEISVTSFNKVIFEIGAWGVGFLVLALYIKWLGNLFATSKAGFLFAVAAQLIVATLLALSAMKSEEEKGDTVKTTTPHLDPVNDLIPFYLYEKPVADSAPAKNDPKVTEFFRELEAHNWDYDKVFNQAKKAFWKNREANIRAKAESDVAFMAILTAFENHKYGGGPKPTVEQFI